MERSCSKPIDLTYNTQLKVTISRYYTPSGRCIQALDYTNKEKTVALPEHKKKTITPLKRRRQNCLWWWWHLTWCTTRRDKTSVIANALEKMMPFLLRHYYYYKKTYPWGQIPNFSTSDYQAFKQFIKAPKYSFETELN
jgi:carboxyl-terminal processing protease